VATESKTIHLEPLVMQGLSAGASIYSAAIDVSQVLAAKVYIDAANVGTLNPNITCPRFEVQVSEHNAGNGTWVAIKEFIVPSFGGGTWMAPAPLAAAANIGDTVLNTGVDLWWSTNRKGPRYIFIKDPVPALSEWNQNTGYTAPNMGLTDGLTNAHPITTTIVYAATRQVMDIGLRSVTRMRLAFLNNDTIGIRIPRDFIVRVALITTDSMIP
jgi:hypothetical protein